MSMLSHTRPEPEGFDISVLEIFWPLCFGFSLFLVSAARLAVGPTRWCGGLPLCDEVKKKGRSSNIYRLNVTAEAEHHDLKIGKNKKFKPKNLHFDRSNTSSFFGCNDGGKNTRQSCEHQRHKANTARNGPKLASLASSQVGKREADRLLDDAKNGS